MKTQIQKWGNSLAIRIPASFAKEAHLSRDANVDISVRGGELIIAPVKPIYTLEELLAQVTPDNLHPEQEYGPAVGAEEWG